jgi:hypothetical protein
MLYVIFLAGLVLLIFSIGLASQGASWYRISLMWAAGFALMLLAFFADSPAAHTSFDAPLTATDHRTR